MKTEAQIESLLRKAPTPKPAPNLAPALKSAIKLPSHANGADLELSVPLWRRWFPALAYAVLILGCVVVLAVQNNQQRELLRQNEQLRQEIAMAEEAAAERQQQLAKAQSAAREIEQLQRDAAEAERLAVRLAELQAQIAALTAQAKDLEAQLAKVPERESVIAPYDFFHDPQGAIQQAREQEGSPGCLLNLSTINWALRVWAAKNDRVFPPDLRSMSNELNTAFVLCCPRDSVSREIAETLFRPDGRGWSEWPGNGGSYEMPGAGLDENSPDTGDAVLVRCRIHGHGIRGAGSVFRARPQENTNQ